MLKPQFGLWCCWQRKMITLRLFGRLFQITRQRNELFSQRRDRRRIRVMGWSIKLFGE